MDSHLVRTLALYRREGVAPAVAFAKAAGIEVEAQRVRVIVVAADKTEPVVQAARDLGAQVETTYRDLVQVLVPIPSLEALADHTSVRFVHPPLLSFPLVTSEGVSLTGANAWQAAGYNGAGVKVAIVDLGFQGYTALLGTELPTTVITTCTQRTLDSTTNHGTGVAEIVYDMAPAATMYLVNYGTEAELGNAVSCLIIQGVNVVNHSAGGMYQGPGDGTGPLNSIVDTAVRGASSGPMRPGTTPKNTGEAPGATPMATTGTTGARSMRATPSTPRQAIGLRLPCAGTTPGEPPATTTTCTSTGVATIR